MQTTRTVNYAFYNVVVKFCEIFMCVCKQNETKKKKQEILSAD